MAFQGHLHSSTYLHTDTDTQIKIKEFSLMWLVTHNINPSIGRQKQEDL